MGNFFKNYKERFLFAIMFNILIIAMQIFQKAVESYLSDKPLSSGFLFSYLFSFLILTSMIVLLKGNSFLSNRNTRKYKR